MGTRVMLVSILCHPGEGGQSFGEKSWPQKTPRSRNSEAVAGHTNDVKVLQEIPCQSAITNSKPLIMRSIRPDRQTNLLQAPYPTLANV
jgi:hypothetical protein